MPRSKMAGSMSATKFVANLKGQYTLQRKST